MKEKFKSLLYEIAEKEDFKIKKITELHGGDINKVFSVTTSTEKRVLKLNHAEAFPKMFEKEAKGLNLLSASNSFRIPKVYAYGKVKSMAYLILEKIDTGNKPKDFWVDFAESLVELHQSSSPTFGLDHDNYIGSLPQYNQGQYSKLASFYIEKRLIPQLKQAQDHGFRLNYSKSLFLTIEKLFPNENPMLIHGDLWGGNYLVDEKGRPVLIDPAVSYVSREMDLAMMQLFGGFSPQVYGHYNRLYPLEIGWENRIELWQLYYLLVHLNLFGESYLSSVLQIIQKYDRNR